LKQNNCKQEAIGRQQNDRLVYLSLLLSIWVVLGLTLRLTNLALKPASSIEIATIGYSLGHGFDAIPLNQLVSQETLLAPLRLDTAIGYADVFERLIQESTHPPLYFWLTHWWIKLWLEDGDLVSLQIARSLSAIFGTLAIPAIFGLSWVAFRSRLVAHFAAVLMAISPYGIYLAQEARHYTLTVLWVIGSVTCLVKAVQLIKQKKPLPLWLNCVWIVINALGVATHYFFVIALSAEAIAIIPIWWLHRRQLSFKYWRSLYLAACGTLVGCLVWLPLVTGVSDNELTTWIQTSFDIKEILLPPFLLLGWVQSMIVLLPLEGVPTVVIVISFLVLQTVLIWSIPKLIKGWRIELANDLEHTGMAIASSYLIGSILLFLVIIYGLGRNLSLAARYHFVYFPVLILLVAVALANCWHSQLKTKRVVGVLFAMGLLGSLTVINNYGYQKSQPSDLTAAFIQTTSTHPAVIATSYSTHSQTRELISLAYSFNREPTNNQRNANLSDSTPKFLLNQLYINGVDLGLSNLDHSIATQKKPLDLWTINLGIGEASMNQIRCFENTTLELPKDGYLDRLYRCDP
jgi:uncharacterized membrane protein